MYWPRAAADLSKVATGGRGGGGGGGLLLPPIVVKMSCQDKFCQLFERFNKSLFQATVFWKKKYLYIFCSSHENRYLHK